VTNSRVVTSPRVILIIRLSAMGDLVMASGFAKALRGQHPQAHLVWLVQDRFAEVAALIPEVDAVMVWPRKAWQAHLKARDWGALWGAVRDFRRSLRSLQADWSIDLQGLLKSGLMGWWSGARVRWSLGGREGSRFLATAVLDREDGRAAHLADMGAEYRNLAVALGSPDPLRARPTLALPDDSLMRAQRWLREQTGVAEPAPTPDFLALVPFTTRPQKHWLESHWTELIDQLRQAPGLRLIILGGPADRDLAQRLCEGRPEMLHAAGALSIADSMALLAKARGVIGVDTGLIHAAQALGRPTVVLFGSTIPYQKPLHPGVEILWSARPCSPCGRRPSCGGRFDCQRDLSPGQAEAALRRVTA
jgi:heptosyltransferase-1